jgi:hypothetical protein
MFSSSDNLPGAIPVQIIASLQKGRPAGTSWILPGGSQVDVTTAKTENQLDDEKGAFVYSLMASNNSEVPTLAFFVKISLTNLNSRQEEKTLSERTQ